MPKSQIEGASPDVMYTQWLLAEAFWRKIDPDQLHQHVIDNNRPTMERLGGDPQE